LTRDKKAYIIYEHELSDETKCGYTLRKIRVEGTLVEYVMAKTRR